MKRVFLISMLLLTGCDRTYDNGSTNPKCVQSAMHHIGTVTILDISVGYCEPSGKSGTPVCDRTVTYKTDDGRFYNLGLSRSDQWPPIWKGAHGDIWFWLQKDALDCEDGGAVISEFDEISR